MGQSIKVSGVGLRVALEDFKKARRRAFFEQVSTRLTGRSADLLPYEDVRRLLKARGVRPRGLQRIPLKAIVGSVGRYDDFSRNFLPKKEATKERWTTVRAGVFDLGGLPPIEVYQIGEVYFVIDGNHRVSVAQELGSDTIEAYVTEVTTKVPLTTEDSPETLINKARYVEFLDETKLDQTCPGADLLMTATGQYRVLLDEIHQWHKCRQKDDETALFVDSAASWYDEVYIPIAHLIQEQGILRDFPERTVTDLYAWLLKHQEELKNVEGMNVPLATAASDLVATHSSRPQRILARLGTKLQQAVMPEGLTASAKAGQWREERQLEQQSCFFKDILVPISEQSAREERIAQAIDIAKWEKGQLHGMVIVPSKTEYNSNQIAEIEADFLARCAQANVTADFMAIVGDPAREIARRARWIDLVVINLPSPYQTQTLAKMRSGFHTLIQRCTRPIFAIPHGNRTACQHALVAYDGSPKAKEALFVAAYLGKEWKTQLTLLSICENDEIFHQTVDPALEYLAQHDLKAQSIVSQEQISKAILQTAQEQDCDLIMMGGFGSHPAIELVVGSAVDNVLQETTIPVLICR